jgi:hypothetical protein
VLALRNHYIFFARELFFNFLALSWFASFHFPFVALKINLYAYDFLSTSPPLIRNDLTNLSCD